MGNWIQKNVNPLDIKLLTLYTKNDLYVLHVTSVHITTSFSFDFPQLADWCWFCLKMQVNVCMKSPKATGWSKHQQVSPEKQQRRHIK